MKLMYENLIPVLLFWFRNELDFSGVKTQKQLRSDNYSLANQSLWEISGLGSNITSIFKKWIANKSFQPKEMFLWGIFNNSNKDNRLVFTLIYFQKTRKIGTMFQRYPGTFTGQKFQICTVHSVSASGLLSPFLCFKFPELILSTLIPYSSKKFGDLMGKC